MEAMGNTLANEYYEAAIPPRYVVPKEGDSVRLWERFIRDKYELKKFVVPGSKLGEGKRPAVTKVEETPSKPATSSTSTPAKGLRLSVGGVREEAAPAKAVDAAFNLLDFNEEVKPSPPPHNSDGFHASFSPPPAAATTSDFGDFSSPSFQTNTAPAARPVADSSSDFTSFAAFPSSTQTSSAQSSQPSPAQESQQPPAQPAKLMVDSASILNLYNVPSPKFAQQQMPYPQMHSPRAAYPHHPHHPPQLQQQFPPQMQLQQQQQYPSPQYQAHAPQHPVVGMGQFPPGQHMPSVAPSSVGGAMFAPQMQQYPPQPTGYQSHHYEMPSSFPQQQPQQQLYQPQEEMYNPSYLPPVPPVPPAYEEDLSHNPFVSAMAGNPYHQYGGGMESPRPQQQQQQQAYGQYMQPLQPPAQVPQQLPPQPSMGIDPFASFNR